MPTLQASGTDHPAPAWRVHARHEPMTPLASPLLWLPSTLRHVSPKFPNPASIRLVSIATSPAQCQSMALGQYIWRWHERAGADAETVGDSRLNEETYETRRSDSLGRSSWPRRQPSCKAETRSQSCRWSLANRRLRQVVRVLSFRAQGSIYGETCRSPGARRTPESPASVRTRLKNRTPPS